jgi:hypothetical protein
MEGIKIILNGIRTEIKAAEKHLAKLRKAESVLSEEAAGPAKKAKAKTNGNRTKPGVLEGFLVQAFRGRIHVPLTVKEAVKLVKLAGHKFHSEAHEDAVLRSTLARMVKAGKVTKSKDGQGYVVYSLVVTKPETVVKEAEAIQLPAATPVDESGPKEAEVDLGESLESAAAASRKPREPVHQHRKGGLLT